MNDLALRTDDKGVLISLRVRPRGCVNKIEGVRNGALLLSVTAAPEDGKANAAVLNVLSKALKTPKTALSLERGQTVRDKIVRAALLNEDQVRERLSQSLPTTNEPEA